MKKFLLSALLLLSVFSVYAQQGKSSTYIVGFYNLENLWEDAEMTHVPDIN